MGDGGMSQRGSVPDQGATHREYECPVNGCPVCMPVVAVEAGPGVDLIAAERQRQVAAEGWTPEHDDEHGHGQLAAAAACYAAEAWMPLTESHRNPPRDWPWESHWWKPTGDPVRDLVKAGALIVAEIDRLQRATPGEPEADSVAS